MAHISFSYVHAPEFGKKSIQSLRLVWQTNEIWLAWAIFLLGVAGCALQSYMSHQPLAIEGIWTFVLVGFVGLLVAIINGNWALVGLMLFTLPLMALIGKALESISPNIMPIHKALAVLARIFLYL